MKISISYPALASEKGVPLLSQNRQFQWFSKPTYIYPVVPAYLATFLQSKGHNVFWNDAIAENINFEEWLTKIQENEPDIIVMESKTPVIRRHWNIIKILKEKCLWHPKVVLIGDHVTALPLESMENSLVDFIVTGGDYDFTTTYLVEALTNNTELPKGVWYRNDGVICNTGEPDFEHDLNDLPLIDRELTKWQLYAYENGNFKYRPGTYVMAGRDCWWGKCSFCSWTTLCPGNTYRTISVERHLDEIEELVNKYGIKEIFDDSGCFPKGKWLDDFCDGIVKRGLHKKVVLGCNMRMGELSAKQWQAMKKANFRFVLIGLESVNQDTLNKLNKGIKSEWIEDTLKKCKGAGLEPHITLMVGYPWETKEDARRSVDFAKKMFQDGYIDSLQATIVVPYPGTPMFDEAKKQGWLLVDGTSEDWDRFDMRESLWKSPIGVNEVKEFTQELYKSALSPKFIFRKIMNIRSFEDIKFLFRTGFKVLGHLADFNKKGV